MIKVTNKEIKALQSGDLSTSAYAQGLLATYPAVDIALAFAELLATKDMPVSNNKISVTEDELKDIVDMFRVKGTSNRGRPKTKKAE